MANQEYLDFLLECVENNNIAKWNSWRRDIVGLPEEELVDTPNGKLRKVDLSDADLPNLNLAKINLQKVNLENASLNDAYLENANLYGANLCGVNLTNANLSLADLQNSDLRGANLSGTQLSAANLKNASLVGCQLFAANLQNADLSKSNLRGAHLGCTNLQGADLKEANLQNANLQSANLQIADLRGANLQGANLQGANLQEVNLQDAILGAKLQQELAKLGVEHNVATSSRIEAMRREETLQQKEKDLQKKEKDLQKKISELEHSKQQNTTNQQDETAEVKKELENVKRERGEIKETLEKDIQAQAKTKSRREEYSIAIKNALECIQEPNKYISCETIILNRLFKIYLFLSAVSAGCLIYFVYETCSNPLLFSGIAPEFGLYVYLNYIAPKVISLVLFSTFLTLANRSRRAIQGLQERKRSVEQLRGALLAINELSDSPEVALSRIDKIMDSLSNRALDFTEGAAHGNPDAHDKEDSVIPLDKLKGFLVR